VCTPSRRGTGSARFPIAITSPYRAKTRPWRLVAGERAGFALKSSDNELARLLAGHWSAATFFSVIKESSRHGTDVPSRRGFRRGEDRVVAVLSHRCWAGKIPLDPQIVGAQVRLNGQPATIVGRSSGGTSRTDYCCGIYVPLAMGRRECPLRSALRATRSGRSLALFGRLRRGSRPARLRRIRRLASQSRAELIRTRNRHARSACCRK